MTPFKLSYAIDRDTVNITLGREISRETRFPELDLNKVKRVVLDFDKTQVINSGGVRNWVMWATDLEKINSEIQIILKNVRFVLVKQESLITGFFPKRSSVVSMYVPFACDGCGQTLNKKVDLGRPARADELQKQFASALGEINCPKCGHKMELDALEEQLTRLIGSYARHVS